MHNSPGGRPPIPEADEAIRSLAAIWEEFTNTRPTIITNSASGQKRGLILDFCKIVINPIYETRSLQPPSIQSLAQKILYPSDKEQ